MSRNGRGTGGKAAAEAVDTWRILAAGGREPASIRSLEHRPGGSRKSSVFLLRAAGPDGEDVVAKRCSAGIARLERRVYEEMLPKAGVPTLRVYGVLPVETADRAWLFLEAAEGPEQPWGSAAYRRRLTRWLAALHRGLAGASPPTWLPKRDAEFYERASGTARGALRRAVRNPRLTRADLELLHRLMLLLSRIEDRWHGLWRSFAHVPSTLVHGDLVPKNARIGADAETVRVFDWEFAGWGPPAADFPPVEASEYARHADGFWPGCTAREVELFSRMGVLLRYTMATEWAARGLRWPWVERPLRQLRVYEPRMAAALTELSPGALRVRGRCP